jgi:hypothetical protein
LFGDDTFNLFQWSRDLAALAQIWRIANLENQGDYFMLPMLKLLTDAVSVTASRFKAACQSLWKRISLLELPESLKGVQFQRVVVIAFVGLLLLTTSVDNADLNSSTKAMLNDMIERGANDRPVTTGQWQAENEQTPWQPAKQAKRIAKESADAVEEMGEIYPDNAKTVMPGMENRTLEADDR